MGVLEVVEFFYINLFQKGTTDQECVDKVLGTVGAKLPAVDRQMCNGDIMIEEIHAAINQTRPNKSPGSDGLTHEFYKAFSDILAPILLRVYRCIEERREVPESMATGVITILFKSRGSLIGL